MLIVSEKNSNVSFLSFFGTKAMHFTFSQPVIGCMKLFGMHFIAIGVKLLLATSFVCRLYRLATCKYDCKYIVRTLLPKVQFSAFDLLQSIHDCIELFEISS